MSREGTFLNLANPSKLSKSNLYIELENKQIEE